MEQHDHDILIAVHTSQKLMCKKFDEFIKAQNIRNNKQDERIDKQDEKINSKISLTTSLLINGLYFAGLGSVIAFIAKWVYDLSLLIK